MEKLQLSLWLLLWLALASSVAVVLDLILAKLMMMAMQYCLLVLVEGCFEQQHQDWIVSQKIEPQLDLYWSQQEQQQEQNYQLKQQLHSICLSLSFENSFYSAMAKELLLRLRQEEHQMMEYLQMQQQAIQGYYSLLINYSMITTVIITIFIVKL